MDTRNQVQLIKSQIMNMKLQIDNIDIQNNNMFMMNNNQIGEQLINLSIQILNTGIQTFNIGKNIIINYNKYIDQLKLISQQINILINENNNMIQQQQMMQQQMMIPPPMMGGNWMDMYPNQSSNLDNQEIEIYNIVFRHKYGNIKGIAAQKNMTIEELLNEYKLKTNTNDYEFQNLYFLFNAQKLEKHDKRKIKDVFTPGPNKVIVN